MKQLLETVQSFSGKKVLVVGDLMVDRWTDGVIERLSPEAPVPIILKKNEHVALGGAANVAHNVKTLGGTPILVGVVGNDHAGSVLLKMLQNAGIGTDGVVVDQARPTTEKHRFTTNGNQHLFRLDAEETTPVSSAIESTLVATIDTLIDEADIIVCSDYAKGLFTQSLAKAIIKTANDLHKETIVDLKPANLAYFKGASMIVPNYKEASEMAKCKDLEKIGSKLCRQLGTRVAVTRGAEGISLYQQRGESIEQYHESGRLVRVVDVSGAGDTVSAVVALSLATGLPANEAIKLANAAGAVVVQKERTATISLEELVAAFVSDGSVDAVSVVPKVWGFEKWLENNEKYCCKILSLKKDHQCSLHYHKNKDETFLVTKGHVRLEVGDTVHHLYPGSFVRIAPTQTHRFTGVKDSEMIEVSTHHDESDSYRLEQSRKVELN